MEQNQRKWIDRIYEGICIVRQQEAKIIENPYGAAEYIEGNKAKDLEMAKNIYEYLDKMGMIK